MSSAESFQPLYTQENAHKNSSPLKSRANKTPKSNLMATIRCGMPGFSRIHTPHADAAPSLLPTSRTPEFDSYFRPCIFPEKQNPPQFVGGATVAYLMACLGTEATAATEEGAAVLPTPVPALLTEDDVCCRCHGRRSCRRRYRSRGGGQEEGGRGGGGRRPLQPLRLIVHRYMDQSMFILAFACCR